MGKIVSGNLPCLDQINCKSSDARRVYEDGTSFCFSCKSFFPKVAGEVITREEGDRYIAKARQKTPDDLMKELNEIKSLPCRGFVERKISKTVCEFFGVKVSYNSDGQIDTHYYPYDGGSAYKVRELPKTFKWVSKSTSLFGKDKFNGGGRKLIIVEGEVDTLTVAEVSQNRYGKIYPVVGLSSAVMTKSLLENREWIRSFGEVILALDEDTAGREALEAAIKIVGVDKAKIAKLPAKDPNEVYLKFGADTLQQAIFDAAAYVPSGIIRKEALWEALVSYNNTPSHPYPECLEGVNKKTKGKRLGEISLFVSGTGSGKSSLMREILYDVLKTTDSKIGVIALEESPAETARKFAGLALNKNPAYEELSLDDLRPGFDEVFGDDRVIVLDHQGAETNDGIVSKIEYMALAGCQYIVLDHITIAVSEGSHGLTGLEAQDKMMNELLKVVKRMNIWLGLVSHLRKTQGQGKSFEEGKLPNLDDIRGSGSTKQISMDVVAFARNMSHPDETVRNTIKMSVLKCRYTGLTGPVNGAAYDFKTGRLHGIDNFGPEPVENESQDAERF